MEVGKTEVGGSLNGGKRRSATDPGKKGKARKRVLFRTKEVDSVKRSISASVEGRAKLGWADWLSPNLRHPRRVEHPREEPSRNPRESAADAGADQFETGAPQARCAKRSVLFRSIAMVIGPTPPGTGVILLATFWQLA